MDEIEDANDDIDDGKLLFIGNNQKKNLTVTLLKSHQIFSQLFIMEKFY